MGGNGGGFGFSWEIYVKETRPKGQRLPNEVDPERAQLHYTPYVKDESDAGTASSWNLLESVDAALPGNPGTLNPTRSRSERWMATSL